MTETINVNKKGFKQGQRKHKGGSHRPFAKSRTLPALWLFFFGYFQYLPAAVITAVSASSVRLDFLAALRAYRNWHCAKGPEKFRLAVMSAGVGNSSFRSRH
jgi:hypothetical protein